MLLRKTLVSMIRLRVRSYLSDASKSNMALGVMLGLLVLLVGLTAFRTYRLYSPPANEMNWELRGMFDFHNGTYFPAKAFRDGVNPYGSESIEKYTITREAAAYSPFMFMIHLPWTYLPVELADAGYFAFNLLMLLTLCWLTIHFVKGHQLDKKQTLFAVLGVANLVLLSRPGHITMFSGYFTLEIVLGCVFAIHFAKSRPALSGIGILFASIKPTFFIPLVILMVCRRHYRAVAYGLAFSAVFVAIGLGWLSYHSSLDNVIAGIQRGQDAHHEDLTEFPFYSWTRVDSAGMLAKVLNWNPDGKVYLALMLAFLIIPGYLIYRLSEIEFNSGTNGLTGWILFMTILIGIYHHSYDCLLIVVPWVGITFFGSKTIPEVSENGRMMITLLTAIPAANYLSTQSALGRFDFIEERGVIWQTITLINGVCLFAALAILIFFAVKHLQKQKSSAHQLA